MRNLLSNTITQIINKKQQNGKWFVYILKYYSKNNMFRFYTGIAKDVLTRFKQHLNKQVKTTKYAKKIELVYVEIQPNRKMAYNRELEIKKYSRKEKFSLLETIGIDNV